MSHPSHWLSVTKPNASRLFLHSQWKALHFHLRLSSCGALQFSGQLNASTQTRCENHKHKSEKPVSEIPIVYKTRTYANEVEDQSRASNTSSVACTLKIGRDSMSTRVSKEERKRVRSSRTINAGSLKNKDIDDVVQLSIAPAEAVVICETVSSGLQCETLVDAALLEVTLRVKQARKECQLEFTMAAASMPSHVLDETHQLSDLDDDIMQDAFIDVGLSFNQSNGMPEDFFLNGRPSSNNQQLVSQSNSCSPLDGPILEINGEHMSEASRMKLTAQDNIDDIMAETSGPSTIKKAASLIADQIVSEQDRRVFEAPKITVQGDANTRKCTKALFIQETSFISEFMDLLDNDVSVKGPDVGGLEEVASSSTAFYAVAEDKKPSYKEPFLAQDLVGSSGVSPADPLCSVVPCSISSVNTPPDSKWKETSGQMEDLANSGLPVCSSNLNIKCTASNPKVGGPGFSKSAAEGSVVLCRRIFNSLKSYSLVMPDQDMVAGLACANSASPGSTKEPLSTIGKTTTFLLFEKDSSSTPLCTREKCMENNGSPHKYSYTSDNYEQVEQPMPIVRTDDCDTANQLYQHEGRSTPLVFGSMIRWRRLWACKTFPSSSMGDNTIGSFPAPKMKNDSSKSFMNDCSCRDHANNALLVPLRPNLGSQSRDRNNIPAKGVNFFEAKIDADATGTRRKGKSPYEVQGSNSRKRKRTKRSNPQNKPEAGKEKCDCFGCYLTTNQKKLGLQGFEFLLTGFSPQKERKLKAVIRELGGYVLSSIPPSSVNAGGSHRLGSPTRKLPIVLSPKKVKSTKFLYGCAINTLMLSANWLLDSVEAATLLAPGKYMNRQITASEGIHWQGEMPFCFYNCSIIFDKLGAILYGRSSFCSKFSKIIMHGGGRVYKSPQGLVQSLSSGKNSVGIILVEDERNVSHHLKQCALEHNLQTMTASWIINSLFSGKLLPFKKNRYASLHRIKMPTFPQEQPSDSSQEI